MKKSSIIIIYFFASTLAWSQEKVSKVHFGLSATPQLNITSFGHTKWVDNKSTIGFDIGGDVYFDISDQSQIKIGIHFQNVSLKQRDYSPLFPDDWDPVAGEVDIHKSYYEFSSSLVFAGFPVEFKLKTSNNPNHIYLLGGMHVRYKISSSGKVSLIESSVNTIMLDPDNYIFETKNFQPYFVAGGGYEWKRGAGKFSLGPVFEYSASKIFNTLSSTLHNGHFAFVGIRLLYY